MSRVLFRTLAGFIVAPISPALLLAIGSVFFGRFGEGLWGIGFAALVGYPVALILGVPIYLVLRWRGWVGFWVDFAAGILLGALVYLAYIPPVTHLDGSLRIDAGKLKTAPLGLLLGMISGIVATICFWLIARPDRTGLESE
jgi:hypothetical protein